MVIPLFVLGLSLISLTLFVFWISASYIIDWVEKSGWKPSECVIVSTDVKTIEFFGEALNDVDVRVSYRWQERVLQSTISISQVDSYDTNKIVKRNPTGSTQSCLVDADEPERAALASATSFRFMIIPGLVIFLIFGAGGAVMIYFSIQDDIRDNRSMTNFGFSRHRFTVFVMTAIVTASVIAPLINLVYLAGTSQLVLDLQLIESWYKKLLPIILNNMNFWVVALAGVAYGFWRKVTNPRYFTWLELPVQLVVGVVLTVMYFVIFIIWTSGIHDREILNGYVTSAEYYEEWTELESYENCDDSNNSCTTETREIHHPAEWKIQTSFDDRLSISKSAYQSYVKQFNDEEKIELGRSSQVSSGDGNAFVSSWLGENGNIVPVSVSSPYVNYLRASRSIHKKLGISETYIDYLLPYPALERTDFGVIEFNRVLSAGVELPLQWGKQVDRQLDLALTTLGSAKQVNLVVYLVAADRGFLHALEEHWISGKKNDVVLVIGMQKFPLVDWAGVMVFQGNEELKVALRDEIESRKDISDAAEVSALLVKQVEDYYQRVPVAELEHLLYDIELDWSMLLFMCSLIAMGIIITSYQLETNRRIDVKAKR